MAHQAGVVAGGGLSEPAAARLPSAGAGARDGTPPSRTVTAGLARFERESLWLYVLAAYALLLAVKLPALVAPDTWLALVGGREIVEQGIPRQDTLTVWTAGADWVDQQWLAQLTLYGAAVAGGLRLALVLHVGLLVGTLAVVLVAARRLGASPRSTAVGGALCLLGAAASTALRTETLAFPLFALLLWLLVSDSRAPSSRVLLALPLMALWANLHGSALLAAALLMVRGIDCARRRPAVSAALVAGGPAALLASPYGLSVIGYYERTIGNRSLSEFVTEWAPPSFPSDWRVFLVAAAALWLVSRHAALLTRYEKLLFALLVLGALSANRNAVWLALFCGMVLPRLLDAEWPATAAPPPRRLNAIAWGAVTVMSVSVIVPAFAHEPGWYEQRYPAEAATRVAHVTRADPSARVISSEWFADWLLWKVPEAKGRVAFDVRFELLSDAQHVQLSEFTNAAEGWQELVKGYRVVVLEPERHERNEKALLSSGSAHRVFRNDWISVLLLETRAS